MGVQRQRLMTITDSIPDPVDPQIDADDSAEKRPSLPESTPAPSEVEADNRCPWRGQSFYFRVGGQIRSSEAGRRFLVSVLGHADL